MKVPVIEGPGVAPSGDLSAQPVMGRDNPAVGNAIASSGQALGNFVERGMDNVQRAQQAATAIQETQALANLEGTFQRYIGGDSSPQGQQELAALGLPGAGFKGVSGLQETGDASQRTQLAMEKALEASAGSFKDPQAQAVFRAKATHLYNAYHRDLEQHFAAQMQKDKVASGEGFVAQHLAGATSGQMDPGTAAQGRVVLMQQLRQLGWEPAKVQAVGEASAAAVVEGLLANHKLADAQDYVAREASQLGALYGKVKLRVDTAAGFTDKDLQRAQVVRAVSGWANDARDTEGVVHLDQLQERADAAQEKEGWGIENPLYQEMLQEVSRQKTLAAKETKQRVDGASDVITREYLINRGPMPAAEEQFLKDYEPARLDSLIQKRDARDRADAIKARGTAGQKGALNKSEAQLRRALEEAWRGELVDNPSANPQEFTTSFLARHGKQGMDVPMDLEERLARLGKERSKSADTAGMRDAAAFKSELRGAVLGALGKTGKANPAKVEELVSAGVSQYLDLSQGKPMGPSEKAALIATQVTKSATPGSGWFGTDVFAKQETPLARGARAKAEGAAAPPPAAPPAGEEMVKVKRKADGKTGRMPKSKVDATKYEVLP